VPQHQYCCCSGAYHWRHIRPKCWTHWLQRLAWCVPNDVSRGSRLRVSLHAFEPFIEGSPYPIEEVPCPSQTRAQEGLCCRDDHYWSTFLEQFDAASLQFQCVVQMVRLVTLPTYTIHNLPHQERRRDSTTTPVCRYRLLWSCITHHKYTCLPACIPVASLLLLRNLGLRLPSGLGYPRPSPYGAIESFLPYPWLLELSSHQHKHEHRLYLSARGSTNAR
jgi:hypothetical protein